jgi:phosphosulfolactate phosphohydrolase-like enzyme
MKSLEAHFTPADFGELNKRDLSNATCVVFDVFRATSSMITALANGAAAIIPVAEIPEALAIREKNPGVLLAGERDGLRIRADLTGGVDFDLGNSPREFTPDKVGDKTIAISTTNGTRALRACAHAKTVLIGSFLNLRATAGFILEHRPEELILVCSGTFEQSALEDVLGAGALADLVWNQFSGGAISDSALMARQLYQRGQANILEAAAQSRNGKRLLSRPELKDDVAFALRRDVHDFVAMMRNGTIRVDHSNREGENTRRFAAAIRRFDEENSRDPNTEMFDGSARPRELVYAEWLTGWVLKLCPNASEALRLAARSQHICRWMMPRDSYPMTRAGYLQWRADLKKFHAQKSGEILRDVGYPEEIVQRVQNLNLKKDFPKDPECCVLEDALCLVFLEHQLAPLASKTDDEKVIAALQKSWKKMTEAGRAEALKLSYRPRETELLRRALKSS